MCTASPYEYSERSVIFRDRNGGSRLTDMAASVLNKAHTVVNPLGTCPALGAPLQMVSTKTCLFQHGRHHRIGRPHDLGYGQQLGRCASRSHRLCRVSAARSPSSSCGL